MYKLLNGKTVEMTAEEIAAFEASREPEPLTQADFTRGIEAHVDAVARERDYSDAVSAVSYVDDPNPQFDAEARAFRAWRSLVWTYAIEKLALVQAGERDAPKSVDAFIAELPVIEWPE